MANNNNEQKSDFPKKTVTEIANIQMDKEFYGVDEELEDQLPIQQMPLNVFATRNES